MLLLRVALLVLAVASASPVYDDDEFEVAVEEKKVVEEQKKADETPQYVPPTPAPSTVGRFTAEIVFAIFVALFAANFVRSSGANKRTAVEVLQHIRPALLENFSRVDTLTRISPDTFKLYCTGRLNCYAAEVTISLPSSQDLLWRTASLVLASRATLSILVPLPEQIEPIVFALLPLRKENRFREELPDLALTKPRETSLPAHLACLSDTGEAARRLASEVASLVNAHPAIGDKLLLVYASDTFEAFETEYKQMCKFEISANCAGADLDAFVRFALRFVDVVAGTTLTVKGREKAKQARKIRAAAKSKETREEAEAKIGEKKLAALAAERERMAGLTGKELAKAEEKMRKKELKEKNAKRTKIIK